MDLNTKPSLPEAGEHKAQILPLGDRAMLVRFGDKLNDDANAQSIAAASILTSAGLPAVEEICPNLISVLLRYDPTKADFFGLSAQVQLALSTPFNAKNEEKTTYDIPILFGGESGPDLTFVAQTCKMSVDAFIAAHNSAKLRVMATGFAPGFVYCGMHTKDMHVPRRTQLHKLVSPGSILFAAGQTAIAATPIPTGWHVIGHTDFNNFNANKRPPTILRAGDHLRFCVASPK